MKNQLVAKLLRALYLPLLLIIISADYCTAQPVVSSFSQYSGAPGATVTISGSNFNDTAANNVVFFGSTQAAVTAATTTSLTVTVPGGSTYQSVSILNKTTGLTGFAPYPFLATHSSTAYVAGKVNFSHSIDSITGNFPNAVVACDLDGDGLPDIVGADFNDGAIYLFKNTSAGGTLGFAAIDTIRTGSGAYRLCVADVDGDGKPDIVVPDRAASSVRLLRNTSTPGTITFAAGVTLASPSEPNAVAINDIDGDGKPDIVVACQFGHKLSVFRNTGTPGTFSFASRVDVSLPKDGYQVAVGDIDGDGKPDIAVSEGFGADSICVFRNTSTPGSISLATMQTFTTGHQPLYVGLTDVDGDGKLDMISANLNSLTLSVFLNTSSSGSVSFAAKVDISTSGRCGWYSVADYDGDGKPDIFSADGGAQKVGVFVNSSTPGSLSLSSEVTFSAPGDAAAIVATDLDGDGLPDMVATSQALNKIYFYKNNPLYDIAGTAVMCKGSTTSLTDAATDGTWASSNSAVASVGSTGIVTGVSAGTARISYIGTATVTSATDVVTQTVTVNALPAISAGGTASVCTGSSATLTASGGTSYSWAPATGLTATTGTGIVATPSSSVTYTVTGTDVRGCTNTATQLVSVNPLPSAVSVSGGGSACGATTLSASGGTGGTIYYQGTVTGGTSVSIPSTSQLITSSGVYYFRARSSAGCWGTQGNASVTVNPLPVTTYSVTGGGPLCSGSRGVAVGLSSSDAGINYKLFRGLTLLSTVAGTGSALSFGSQSVAGTYSVMAANAVTSCSATMTGSANITSSSSPAPALVAVTGGGGYCAGGTGVNIGVAGSAVGINYQLFHGLVAVTAPVPGAGMALSFGPQTLGGIYTVVATNPSSGCSNSMSGTASVYVYTVPAIYTVTGGGSYCSGGAGVHVGINGSASGVSYKLFRGGTPVGSPVAGTGSAIDFGLEATAGTYTVTATNAVYGCVSNMASSATVTVNSLPAVSGLSAVAPGSSITLAGTPSGGFWSSSAPAVAAAGSSTGIVTGISLGTSVITYTLSTGCTGTHIVYVSGFAHREENTTSASQYGGEIVVVPNPNNGRFSIRGTLRGNDARQAFVEIRDMAGRLISSQIADVSNGSIETVIQLERVAAGMYIVHIVAADEHYALRMSVAE